MMYGLEEGQIIVLERKGYSHDEYPKRIGRRRPEKECYEIVQICRSQIIVKDVIGLKRGVSIGELIVMGILRQSDRIEELREERNQEEENAKRGEYKKRSDTPL